MHLTVPCACGSCLTTKVSLCCFPYIRKGSHHNIAFCNGVVLLQEAFNVIDQNRDGFIDKDDLIEMLTSLGKNPTDEYIDEMVNEAPGESY